MQQITDQNPSICILHLLRKTEICLKKDNIKKNMF